jgi:hypothetical protein
MDADFTVELGIDDETLAFPWSAPGGYPNYSDLKRHPELIKELEEVRRVPELAGFLRAMNSSAGLLETAKCDVWPSSELNLEEDIFGASCKFGGYFDLLFSNENTRLSFHEHESLATGVVKLLNAAPELPAAAELLIRRCFYHQPDSTREGFYITCYVFGYGDDEPQARQRWAIGCELVANAIRQVEAA